VKRIALRLLALALALMLLGAAALSEVRTTGNVWLRSGPGLSYSQVTSFSEGKSLTYLGQSSVDERGVTWYKVSSGSHTGWVSSRYARLIGETEAPAASASASPTDAPVFLPVATVQPTATPTSQPTAEPTAQPTTEPTAQPTAEPTAQPVQTQEAPSTLPALNAGLLFTNSVNGDQGAPVQTPEAEEKAVELSNYYLGELVTTANALNLISYRQVESEAPYQYYNDAVIVAGNQYVENIVVYGAGYEVYGVRVGMNANTAMAYLNAAGLDYVSSKNGITYEHIGSEDSLYVDEQGHDSCINLWIDESNLVREIDWSTYTG